MAYSFTSQGIINSMLVQPTSDDPFFNPTTTKLTGFAYDGFQYASGVKQSGVASWASEGLNSNFRGATVAFPNPALVLATASALTIADASDDSLPMWMVFLNGDSMAMANNFNGTCGFTPASISYSNGAIVLVSTPDKSSGIQSVLAVCFDFVQDCISLEVAQ